MKIETILTPAELPALAQRDLRATACVVFDVLRATSTFVTALHHGAQAIIPVSEIAEALAFKKSEARGQRSEVIFLGGERNGVRISANGIDFDLGNSPREYTPERVLGKIIVSTTTNGTRALRACARAKIVLAASFLNLTATAEFLRGENEILLVCAGTGDAIADEDVLAAGALAELLISDTQEQVGRAVLCPPSSANRDVLVHPNGAQRTARPTLTPTSETALKNWQAAKLDLLAAMSRAKNGMRLLAIPELREDVAFCARRDVFPLVAKMSPDGALRRV
jgi:2-phosphosulfolactate phosphatase